MEADTESLAARPGSNLAEEEVAETDGIGGGTAATEAEPPVG